MTRRKPEGRVDSFIVPSRFRTRPNKGWLFRVAGFCEHGTLLDFDDTMSEDTAKFVIEQMFAGEKYRKGVGLAVVFDEKGEEVRRIKKEGS